MKKQYDDDDGRTIANMNVDGMPWYHKPRKQETVSNKELPREDLSREGRIGLYWGVFKAVGLVALAFFLVYFLLIFGLTRLWA